MTQYIYPQNLKAKASLWLWGMRDFVILCVAALLSVVALVNGNPIRCRPPPAFRGNLDRLAQDPLYHLHRGGGRTCSYRTY